MTGILSWAGHRWIGLTIRWYLGYVFVAACLHKIAHPAAFAVDVATYDILPLVLVNIMTIVLPWIELFAGTMLISGFRARAGAMMVFGMMVMFIVALAMALNAGIDMSCGCFASQAAAGEDPISYKTVLRDLGWLGLSVYVLGLDRSPIGIDGFFKRRKVHV